MLEVSNTYEVGVDEAGRGCLFGPVVAAAVVLPLEFPDDIYTHIKDSKKLSEKKRNMLEDYIKQHALSYAIGISIHEEIDKINILQASLKAMHRAINKVYQDLNNNKKPLFTKILVDGNHFKPFLPPGSEEEVIPHECIEQGDNKKLNIAAASILAKCYRDRYIEEGCKNNEQWNHYDLKNNKGYGTAKHLKALQEHGPIEGHRLTFKRVT